MMISFSQLGLLLGEKKTCYKISDTLHIHTWLTGGSQEAAVVCVTVPPQNRRANTTLKSIIMDFLPLYTTLK